MHRAVERIGAERCKCGLSMDHHLDGGACGRFER
jgi:hypothetical protein